MRARRRDQDDRQTIAFKSAAMRLRLVTYRNTVDVIDREAIALAPEEWRVEKQWASASVACQGTSVMNFRETSVMSSSVDELCYSMEADHADAQRALPRRVTRNG